MPGLAERVVDADGLHRVPRRRTPSEVVARDELAEARMEGLDVVVLEIDLDERLPVVVALVDLDAVEHVAREVEVAATPSAAQIGRDVARAVEQQAVPVLQRRAGRG